jgi:hypothetical protein
MSAGTIAAIVVVVVLVVLAIGAITAARRRKLRQRFGPEYDRVAGEKQSQWKADAELAARERRVRSLDIHPLPDAARASFAAEWAAIQERFVDQPQQAVTQAALLVVSVMKEQGYPTEDQEQVIADLSVEHADMLDHYRAARGISLAAEGGTASTENLRLGMLHYRALFAGLLGEPTEPGSESQPAGQPQAP